MEKNILRNILGLFNLNIRFSPTPGICIFKMNVFLDPRKGPFTHRSLYALKHALYLRPKTVLDVGSGGGFHAKKFSDAGCKVTCVDFGTSIYAKTNLNGQKKVLKGDFNTMKILKKFDLVWASHVLEHQQNVGLFLRKLVTLTSKTGHVVITVPDPHRNLWGGHLTTWSPGLLAYNTVLCGVDLSKAYFIRGSNEISLIFQPIKIKLPKLSWDNGDLKMLSKYLPCGLDENRDAWGVIFEKVQLFKNDIIKMGHH